MEVMWGFCLILVVISVATSTYVIHRPNKTVEASTKKFLCVQNCIYQEALKEIREGKNIDRWVWYIFPQFDEADPRSSSHSYVIANIQEAVEFIEDPILGKRIVEACKIIEELPAENISDLLNYSNTQKFKEIITLFALAASNQVVFQDVLDKYFYGEYDEVVLELVGYPVFEGSLAQQVKVLM